MSGLCPFAGQTEYVSAAQCDAYDAQTQINRRSVAIPSARKAEGRRFDPGPGHPLLFSLQLHGFETVDATVSPSGALLMCRRLD